MSETVRVPQLGENVDQVEVVTVLVAVGDRVELDQPVVEVESDKAAVEVPSTRSGVVTHVHVAAGQILVAGDAIVDVAVDAGAAAGTEEAAASVPPGEPGEPAPEPTPEPPQPEPARADSRPEPRPSPPSEPPSAVAEGPPPAAGEGPPRPIAAAPSVRRFAREVGVDIAEVEGSGPHGRVLLDDVKAHAKQRLERPTPAASGGRSVPTPALPDFSQWGEVEVQPMSKVRRLTAERMAQAWATVPQVTHHDLADITELEAFRTRHRDRLEEAGAKLTMTAILVRLVAAALKVFPGLNASIDPAHDSVVLKRYVHIGVAVDTEHGLLVPVIRDADRKSIKTIAVELDDLASRARSRKVTPDELQGASFAISNLGGIGGTGFSPIVNWPQVGILGVSRSTIQPRWVEGDFEPRLMLPLSLSYDHRLVDGAEAARFVRWVAEALEQPMMVLLEG